MNPFLHTLLTRDWKTARVAHHSVIPSQKPRYGRLARPLPTALTQALESLGIRRLYSHQTKALEAIRDGRDVVVATPTASGKSLVYNLAVAESLLEDPAGHALYLFPIKALSRDQLETLHRFFQAVPSQVPFTAQVYDGDTSSHQRAKIRKAPPHVLVTNPDMLHYALLAYHDKWESFWRTLRHVVVDEMHTYRGIFGSHVAQILRRLQRICRHYGSEPRFIFLSATIANPAELAERLMERPAQVVNEAASPRPKRHFVFMESEASLSGLAARIATLALRRGLKTIVFTQSRRMTELVHMALSRSAPDLAPRVSSYRAGFLPSERRHIEQALASGRMAGVVSTSALEMGIDIGGLDVCILVGYPGTVMTTWQRGGRVGRSGRESAIILIPQPDALDQYIVHHPEVLLASRYETAVVDPENEAIVQAHLPCASAELPLTRQEVDAWPETRRRALEELTRRGALLQSEDGTRWFSPSARPHRHVDIRSVGPSYTILAPAPSKKGSWVPLGTNEGIRALKECHPGAVYFHRGQTYVVESLDLEKRVVHARLKDADYFTWVKSEKETEILEVLASKPCANFVARLGRLRVREKITGYEKKRLFTQEVLDFTPLDLPEQVFETVGFWLEIEEAIVDKIRRADLHFMGGIHAMEHAAISMFPLFALSDRNDIGGISIPFHPQLQKSAVFIYDGHPGGIGLAACGYRMVDSLLEKTLELVEGCSCEEGCPACIHSPKCGAGNTPLDKGACIRVLEYLLGRRPLFDEDLSGTVEEALELPPREAEPDPEPPSPAIGYLDLETQRLAQEVGGWRNKHLMRVSVAVLYDSRSGDFHVYREEDIPKLIERLQELDLVVGFNIKRFDYGVLQAYTPYPLKRLPTFDILEAVHAQLGFRLSLDHLGEKTLGRRKTADGLQAVRWFRQGAWDPLIHYCKEDVALTRDLFQFALEKGYLIYEDRSGNRLRIVTSWDLEKMLAKG
ncbi:DEAD/DEAH box helicase [Desulfacinum hydrothermale]|nr:DEAD/DEAH box helicase [Desulfacinum hydrothermale]